MTTWIRFIKDDDRVELVFNSRMTDVHQRSNLDQIVDGMITHMMTQIENPALLADLNSMRSYFRHQFSLFKPDQRKVLSSATRLVSSKESNN